MIICHEIHQSVPVKGIICIRKYQIILTLQPSDPRRPQLRMDLVSRCHASPVTYCSLCHECHARSRSPGGRGLRAQCTAAVWQLHQHSLHQPLATSQGRAQSQCHHYWHVSSRKWSLCGQCMSGPVLVTAALVILWLGRSAEYRLQFAPAAAPGGHRSRRHQQESLAQVGHR